MKQLDLVRKLESGCVLFRHGGRHDIYHNPQTGRSEPVPRHREINENLVVGLSDGWSQVKTNDHGEQEKECRERGGVNYPGVRRSA